MSSTVKFYASLRTCYYGSPLLRRTWICAPPPFFSLDARRQGRTFYSSHRIAFNPPLLHKWNSAFSRGIFTAILFTGAAASYTIIASKPLKLESVEPSGEYLGEEEITQRYSPPIPPVTMAQANEALRWEESYNAVGEGSGVLRFDTVRVPSNSPPEDELISASGYEDDELKWLMWGVFDGHAGCETAVALHDYMVKYIVQELKAVAPNGVASGVAPQSIDQALKLAFLSLDQDIMHPAAEAVSGPASLGDVMSKTGPANSGSCALISFYNSYSQQLKVACSGDSRAVLGRRNAAGKWEATALSADQTGYNKDEIARLQADHPNEPDMIKRGRMLGIAVTRAFGDSRWKWSRALQERAQERFFGHSIEEPYLTPPYLTAEPVITTTKIEPEKGDFLIMASDGLWDKLNNEQAVDLVGRWLNSHDPSHEVAGPNLAQRPTVLAPRQASNKRDPAENKVYSYSESADEKDFVVADENAATHLVRNALGGGNEDMLCGMLTTGPPMSRNLRDDITVQVIFFGNEDATIRNY